MARGSSSSPLQSFLGLLLATISPWQTFLKNISQIPVCKHFLTYQRQRSTSSYYRSTYVQENAFSFIFVLFHERNIDEVIITKAIFKFVHTFKNPHTLVSSALTGIQTDFVLSTWSKNLTVFTNLYKQK